LEKALWACALRPVLSSPERRFDCHHSAAIFGSNLGTESGTELSFGLVGDPKELADELAEASPKMRVCLHAERYANRQHQETRFQFVHGLQLLYAAGVPRIRYK
jgi:hypothetical protein